MRVCHVAPELLPVPPVRGGAIEAWVANVATALAKRGVDVHVLSVADEALTGGEDRVDASGVTYHDVSIPAPLKVFPLDAVARGYYYFRRVGERIAQLHPDIVHYHNRPLGLLIAETTARSGYRRVMSLHNIDYGWCLTSKRVDRLFFERGFAACDRILTVSDFIGAYVRRRLPHLDPERVHTLRNGVESDVFMPNGSADHRQAFGLTRDPLILFAGRIDPRKGVLEVLEVFRRVQRQLPAAQLVIVGPKGSYWDTAVSAYARQVEAAVRKLPNARLLDPIYDRAKLARLYGTADVACLPFASPEGFGMTSIEVQACGVPVVTTSVGGVPETVRNGETGFLVEPNDVNAMTERVLGLLRDRALRAQMSQAAAFAAREFSWRVITDQLLRHYEAILEDKAKVRRQKEKPQGKR